MAKAAELMKVVPAVSVPAAYVGVLSVSEDELVVRTYDEDGNTIEDVSGPLSLAGLETGEHAIFIRGATENSIAGCAVAFLQGGSPPDVYVIDLDDPNTLVEVATTHRPAVGGGQTLSAVLGVGGGFWWECGARFETVPSDAQEIGYLRRISRDGATITATVSSHNLFNDPGTTRTALRGARQIDEDTWAIDTHVDEDESAPVLDTINMAGATGQVSDQALANSFDGGRTALPLGVTAGAPLTRYELQADIYEEVPLFSIPSFTVTRCGTMRTANALVVLVDEGSTATHQASRFCTYAGSHPITTSTAGPAFERDNATEALLWLFGL